MAFDHEEAPVLNALTEYHAAKELGFTPPGHKQARGADPRAVAVLGEAVFAGDVLASGGLDGRLSGGRVLRRAEALMADAVHAEHTFFSTCGSSLSVKAAMLAVTRPHRKLLVGRDAHKSVIAGLILCGVCPVWVEPQWDAERHLAHPPSGRSSTSRAISSTRPSWPPAPTCSAPPAPTCCCTRGRTPGGGRWCSTGRS